MSTSTKTTVNTIGKAAYHAAVVGALAIGYGRIGHMVMKSSLTPQLGKLNSGAVYAIVTIGLAMLNKDSLVASGILPADLMK